MIRQRGIAVSILLTIVTCGIYGIVWMISLSNEISAFNGEKIEGGLEFLLIIVTCGIYGLYWHYKIGQKLVRAQQRAGRYVQDNSIIYLLLAIFQLSIISLAIMQSQENELAI